ncbi:MAG: hypothetical protein IJ325_02695 [Clostridia bacterium]|nr:hypothetical protein [Clostridia bacterium]
MRRKRKVSFKFIYFIFTNILIALSIVAVVYVWALLYKYENCQPENHIEAEIASLHTAARDGSIWNKYTFPDTGAAQTVFESGDLREQYKAAFAADTVTYALKPGTYSENNLVYTLSDGSNTLAEITLESIGEPVTRLAVFTFQEWKVQEVAIVAQARDYTISCPEDFSITVNDILLSAEYGTMQEDGTMLYTVPGLYMVPSLEIRDHNGQVASFQRSGTRIKTEFYDYSLTIPDTLMVTVNGTEHPGELMDNGLHRHSIRMLQNPDVQITDTFGNTVSFTGGNHLPLTYCTVIVPDNYTVLVDGEVPPESVIIVADHPDYVHVQGYAENLPKLATYKIAVLKDGADISVTDKNGVPVEWDKTAHTLDLTVIRTGASMPDDLSAAVDVLGIAKKWSLFMSADLAGSNYGFWDIAQHLIDGSYLYDVAYKWSRSVDITFTSIHYLQDPAFTNITVDNFLWVTDTCFSVDIGFDKNMIVSGSPLVDTMHSTFTFVQHGGQWKLMQIKEIVE